MVSAVGFYQVGQSNINLLTVDRLEIVGATIQYKSTSTLYCIYNLYKLDYT